MKALISDIHSNLEALNAVLADIGKHNVSETYCLGDIVGYGPNPRECIDLVMKCKVVLLGNHDQGAMFDPDGFNPPAERAIDISGISRRAVAPAIACPRCGSRDTRMVSNFGSTSCKALYRCVACREPFDYFKTH